MHSFFPAKNKSPLHNAVQAYLMDLFKGNCETEKPFGSIFRIADCVVEKKHLVFEVQTSPISSSEVLARINDFAKMGYLVVWILHDTCFNHFRKSDVERTLFYHPHYYTNIGPKRRGIIYDQIARYRMGEKIFASKPFPVNLASLSLAPFSFKKRSALIGFREKHWKITFEGDLCDLSSRGLLEGVYKLSIGRF